MVLLLILKHFEWVRYVFIFGEIWLAWDFLKSSIVKAKWRGNMAKLVSIQVIFRLTLAFWEERTKGRFYMLNFSQEPFKENIWENIWALRTLLLSHYPVNTNISISYTLYQILHWIWISSGVFCLFKGICRLRNKKQQDLLETLTGLGKDWRCWLKEFGVFNYPCFCYPLWLQVI